MLEVTDTAWAIDEKDTWKRRFKRLEHYRIDCTPAPDIFHDLYGHLQFLVDLDDAIFCLYLGQCANKYSDNDSDS